VTTVDAMRIFVGRDAAAAAIGVSLPTLDSLIRTGRVEVARVGRRILIRRASLERLHERESGSDGG
jgi:excisionase family DNA binding protein